ncbi:MAG: hypothetical protein KJ729_07870, partial [Euryarchaeota archaeon]|nr:hypothetical protein [Euryarchaeota archaeon]
MTFAGFLFPASSAIAVHGTVFEVPDMDVERTYTYNTTLDVFVPGRDGKEAVLHWGEKAAINGIEYYVFNLSKNGGGELQYLGMDFQNKNINLKKIKDYFTPITFMDLTYDPATLMINYPLWVGKTWEREPVNFSGTVWMGHPVNIDGTTRGSAKVIGEEDIIVPAGIAHALVLETTMNSISMVNGTEMWMNNSQKIWLMENGFFARRQLYHSGRLEEEIELKSPIIAVVDIKPETLNTGSKGEITVFIELPKPYDIARIDINSIGCNGAGAIKSLLENGKLKVKFKRDDLNIEKMTGDKALLTLNGKL